jgi:hypothetical protein
LIRDEILPRLRALHPGADQNLLRLAQGEPSALDELLRRRPARSGSTSAAA